MHPKVETFINDKTWKALMKVKQFSANIGADIYSMNFLTKLHKGYMKFLNVAFHIITMATISLSLLWFFPIYLHVAYDRMMLIVLVLILLQVRYGSMKVTSE
jgi:hypothetical protein